MSASREMPRYKSHKTVWALQISDETILINTDGGITFGVTEVGYEPVTVTKDVVARYMPVAGDFYVVYMDGYKSFSPRKAFLEGYEPEEKADPGLELARMRGLVTPFAPHTVISENSLVIDKNGVAWWVRPDAMQIVKGGLPHVRVHRNDDRNQHALGDVKDVAESSPAHQIGE